MDAIVKRRLLFCTVLVIGTVAWGPARWAQKPLYFGPHSDICPRSSPGKQPRCIPLHSHSSVTAKPEETVTKSTEMNVAITARIHATTYLDLRDTRHTQRR